MPAVFLGHGNPMNALEHNRYGDAWERFADDAPRPKAILAISAHWYVPMSAVTAMQEPRTIHDFSGFPDELFALEYPAPGDPLLAARVAELLSPTEIALDAETWGLDHGTWSVLSHLYPEADIPVVQLSLHAGEPLSYHLALGEALAPLREEGIMIVASGNVVHNLSLMDLSQQNRAAAWARRFDEAAREFMVRDPASLAELAQLPEYPLAVPTPEHFLPLAYLAGLAQAAGGGVRTLIEGYDRGSLSMTSYVLDN